MCQVWHNAWLGHEVERAAGNRAIEARGRKSTLGLYVQTKTDEAKQKKLVLILPGTTRRL